jgi:hypothetical protein
MAEPAGHGTRWAGFPLMRMVPVRVAGAEDARSGQRHVDERRRVGGQFDGVHAAGQIRPLLRGRSERQVERVRRLAVEHELEPAARREQGEIGQQRDVVPGRPTAAAVNHWLMPRYEQPSSPTLPFDPGSV